jgi:peptide/nickel transport system permease protein
MTASAIQQPPRVARRLASAPVTARAALRSPTFLAGTAIIAFWIVCALFGTAFVPQDPYEGNPAATLASPSGAHWFGTDQLGRDVFARVIVGSRDVLIVAPIATLLGIALGTTLGLLMGYARGWFDAAIGRVLEAILALPAVITALVALATIGESNVAVTLVIGFVFTPYVARTVRSVVLQEMELEYIEVARVRGERGSYVMFREILPNVLPVVLVEATVRLAYAVFVVATLSFIGFGIQPPSPNWGVSIAQNYSLINGGFWWPTVFPALAIASLVISVNWVSDGLADAMER